MFNSTSQSISLSFWGQRTARAELHTGPPFSRAELKGGPSEMGERVKEEWEEEKEHEVGNGRLAQGRANGGGARDILLVPVNKESP